MQQTDKNAHRPFVLPLLTLPSFVGAQQPPPTRDLPSVLLSVDDLRPHQDANNFAWQQHLADNKLKIKNGDTGQLIITVNPRKGHALPPQLRARVTEHVPQHARPGPGLHITHHFVQIGNVVDGTFTVRGIPTGLALEIAIWPADESARKARFELAGPKKRGECISLKTSPAKPFPVMAGRVLDTNGDAIRPTCNRHSALAVCSAHGHRRLAHRAAEIGVPFLLPKERIVRGTRRVNAVLCQRRQYDRLGAQDPAGN
ncbi:MAG: hypothetical protein ACI9S9_004054, partial [Planctomycetota bacterium]